MCRPTLCTPHSVFAAEMCNVDSAWVAVDKRSVVVSGLIIMSLLVRGLVECADGRRNAGGKKSYIFFI